MLFKIVKRKKCARAQGSKIVILLDLGSEAITKK